MDTTEIVIEWLRTHPLFKITSMCEALKTDPANFYKAYKAGRISETLLPEVIKVISGYGFKMPEAKQPTAAEKSGSYWDGKLIRREKNK